MLHSQQTLIGTCELFLIVSIFHQETKTNMLVSLHISDFKRAPAEKPAEVKNM